MPLADLLERRFGVKTRGVRDPLGVSPIGVNPVIVLSNNPNRLAFLVVNLSANLVYLDLENDVNVTPGAEVGFRLEPNGGYVGMIWDEDFQMTAWAWWAVSAGANTRLTILEVREI